MSKVDPLKGQFAKNLIHPDVPMSGMLTREEQLLAVNHQQLRELRRMAEQRLGSASPQRIPTPHLAVNVNVPDMARTMRPQFEAMIDSQRELARNVSGLGYQGQQLIQEARQQSDALWTIEEHARSAHQQRNQHTEILARGVAEMQGLNRGVEVMQSQLSGINSTLGVLDQDVREGFNRTVSAVDYLRFAITDMFGDLGMQIETLTYESIQTRLELLQALHRQNELFVWSHREQMWAREQALALQRKGISLQQEGVELQKRQLWVASNPDDIAALNKWKNGERCRNTGDNASAIKMFNDALDINPSEPRAYLSLGLIALNSYYYPDALQYLVAAQAYADENPSIRACALLLLSRLLIFDGQYDAAYKLLEQAAHIDSSNRDILFEMAVCSMHLGKDARAIHFIRTLVSLDRRYIFRILAEPIFEPIMDQIRRIMKP